MSSTHPASTRLRLRTHPPLRPLQAWIPFSPSSSILDLKAIILHLIPSCLSVPLTAQDIQLELDGFTFLDKSPCSMIDPAHDLIDVKSIAPPSCPSQTKTNKKRRRSQSKSNAIPSTVSQPTTLPIQSSANHSVAHDTQSSNARSIKPLSISRPNPQPALQASSIKLPHAPPGQGSASTKARNKRKRLNKLYKRQQNQAPSEKLSVVPVSQQQSAQVQIDGRQDDRTGSSLVVEQAQDKAKGGHCTSTHQDNSTRKLSSAQSQSGQDEITSSSTHDSQSSSASDSESDSSESSSSDPDSSSSPSESGSDSSNSVSSAPSSADVRPPTTFSCPAPLSGPVVAKTVPITHDPQLNMLSLSNKNKRKNLKRGPYVGTCAQPSKIVFHPSGHSPRAPSPFYEPPSPSRPNWSDHSPTAEPFRYGGGEATRAASSGVGIGQAVDRLPDDPQLTPANRSHGPPPSMRAAKLIPPNVMITSVDVLDPSWTAGQIGHRPHAGQESLHQDPASRKNRERNRKKKAKRRRRAANSQCQRAGQGSDERSGGETELDDEGHDDVEEAFTEFISGGGHKATVVEMEGAEEEGKEEKDEMEWLVSQWQELANVDKTTAIVGERIAIQTIGLCLETFTPEKVVYYGTLLESSSTHLKLKLGPGCLVRQEAAPLECDGGWDAEQMDTKEAMRAQLRDGLREDGWGDSRDIREWMWSEVADARKM